MSTVEMELDVLEVCVNVMGTPTQMGIAINKRTQLQVNQLAMKWSKLNKEELTHHLDKHRTIIW